MGEKVGLEFELVQILSYVWLWVGYLGYYQEPRNWPSFYSSMFGVANFVFSHNSCSHEHKIAAIVPRITCRLKQNKTKTKKGVLFPQFGSCVIPISALIFIWHPFYVPVCVFVQISPFYKGTRLYWFKAHFNNLILTQSFAKTLFSFFLFVFQ